MKVSNPELNIRINRRLEPNYLDKTILEIYYNAYVFNLKTYSKFYKCFFVSARDIDFDIPSEQWTSSSDPFLKDPKGIDEEFMQDLLTNGTYWHVALRMNAGRFCIAEGTHRLLAVKRLIEQGRWPAERRLLAVTVERRKESFPSSTDVFYVPIAAEGKLKRGLKDVYSNILPHEDSRAVIRDNFVAKPVSKRDIRIASSAHQHLSVYSAILRDAFFEYRIKTKSVYPPHKAINDEKAWAEWKPEDFTNLLRKF